MSDEDGDGDTIRWRLHLRASPEEVYWMIATAEGRQRFWAESARDVRGRVLFEFPNGANLHAEVLAFERPKRYALRYFEGSSVEFRLDPDGDGGTLLTLTESGISGDSAAHNRPGWVSVLMSLKAAVDHGVDLRNHDPRYTWDEAFVDN